MFQKAQSSSINAKTCSFTRVVSSLHLQLYELRRGKRSTIEVFIISHVEYVLHFRCLFLLCVCVPCLPYLLIPFIMFSIHCCHLTTFSVAATAAAFVAEIRIKYIFAQISQRKINLLSCGIFPFFSTLTHTHTFFSFSDTCDDKIVVKQKQMRYYFSIFSQIPPHTHLSISKGLTSYAQNYSLLISSRQNIMLTSVLFKPKQCL